MRPIAADRAELGGGHLAEAAAFGFDPLSLRLTEALAKNGVIDLSTGDIALLNYAGSSNLKRRSTRPSSHRRIRA
jgi:hypothetical protein